MAMNDKDKEEVEQEVRGILSFHKGRENAISRWQLVEIVFGREAAADRGGNNPFDRQIRKVVEKFRDVDMICSTSGARGYWIASNMNDIEELADVFEKMAKGYLKKKARIIEHGQREFGGQMELLK